MATLRTMTLNGLIKTLQQAKKEIGQQVGGSRKAGEIPVLLSSDSEGNSYSTISAKGGSFAFDTDTLYGSVLTIYPFEEGLDLIDMGY